MIRGGAQAATTPDAQRTLGLVLLVGLTLAWGLNWPFLKIATSEIPVIQFRAVSTGLAALALLALARAIGQPMAVPRRHWAPLVAASIFNITSWHLLIAFAVTLMATSGQTAILAFTMPVWAAILGIFVLKERLTPRRVVSLVGGLLAVVLLTWRDLADLRDHLWGVALAVLGAFNWAVGTVIQKRVKWTVGAIPLAGWQMAIGVVPIVVVACFAGPFVWFDASWQALGSALYLTVIAMVFAYYAWFKIVAIFPASVAAIGTLLVPVVGLISGALVLGEAIGWREMAALVLAVLAVALVVLEKPAAAAPRPDPGT
jgi:drug/metabolite transporter (DMT)-like permease